LIVGYYEGERLLFAAKVGNGFVPLVRCEVASRFKGLEINTCPFANLPENKRTQWALTKEEMKNCVWLKPELVAQIEFTKQSHSSARRGFAIVCPIRREAASVHEFVVPNYCS
jgi:ATP-dependent DNA ligase